MSRSLTRGAKNREGNHASCSTAAGAEEFGFENSAEELGFETQGHRDGGGLARLRVCQYELEHDRKQVRS